jgi:hypothetical protein
LLRKDSAKYNGKRIREMGREGRKERKGKKDIKKRKQI